MRTPPFGLRGIAVAVAMGGLVPATLLAVAYWPARATPSLQDRVTAQQGSRPSPPARALIERAVRDERHRQVIETLDLRSREAPPRH
jgi:hypothetical protein